ncbi:zinc finger CCCH domain-containing protein 18 [Coffea eugenioides]|uniref:zinc finger CCCH domain-containing protein 18 n=1 Tax=Coffea eugenioides TaxID=49369 RepID=UPI000F607FB4|nr:zinc finger CCCH domain-containing protein 18 [Coffea eugenioides]XP_027182583.1 zinc finger CCCH domain-containing protein 18 [Coffea eugenioides]
MADDDDEKALEEQLELQLQEQRGSLNTLNDALALDPSNAELLAVQAELVQAIADVEEGLLHLKRARLLREADFVLQGPKGHVEDVKVESLDPNDVEVEPVVDQSYSVGSKCRFRHTDGRWYNGLILGLEGSNSAKISFLTPTSESMLMCKFFLQQRCRFGSSCRLSHGVDVPISSLKQYIPTVWEQSLAGSSIWALQDAKFGIWREAELESWDEKLNLGHVVFRDDGSSAKLGVGALSLSEFAEVSNEEDSDLGSEETDSSDSGEDNSRGLGFLETTTSQKGIQTETAIFAKWENHTRGIASKMMASMGYRDGMGLGASGQGIVDPIPVKVLPPKQSLDHAVENQENEKDKENQGKKRSRGGKRKREKKFAAACRAAKEQEESEPDVFSLINTQLAKHGETLSGGSTKKQQNMANGAGRNEDRSLLVAYEDEVKELRMRVEKLEEMVIRNKKEKVVYEAAMRKLTETRKLLAEAEAVHASASSAVISKEKEKRWLKF